MEMEFEEQERLFRAVLPADMYWKRKGILSSAALRDIKGLSTDRQMRRPCVECVRLMRERFTGSIVSFAYQDCRSVNALVQYDPLPLNCYHTLILHDDKDKRLTKGQARQLVELSRVDFLHQADVNRGEDERAVQGACTTPFTAIEDMPSGGNS